MMNSYDILDDGSDLSELSDAASRAQTPGEAATPQTSPRQNNTGRIASTSPQPYNAPETYGASGTKPRRGRKRKGSYKEQETKRSSRARLAGSTPVEIDDGNAGVHNDKRAKRLSIRNSSQKSLGNSEFASKESLAKSPENNDGHTALKNERKAPIRRTRGKTAQTESDGDEEGNASSLPKRQKKSRRNDTKRKSAEREDVDDRPNNNMLKSALQSDDDHELEDNSSDAFSEMTSVSGNSTPEKDHYNKRAKIPKKTSNTYPETGKKSREEIPRKQTSAIPAKNLASNLTASPTGVRLSQSSDTMTATPPLKPQAKNVVRKASNMSLLNNLMGFGSSSTPLSKPGQVGSPGRNTLSKPRPGAPGNPALRNNPSSTANQLPSEGVSKGDSTSHEAVLPGPASSTSISSPSTVREKNTQKDERLVTMEMGRKREQERIAHEHPHGLFDLLEGAEIMMDFEEETRHELRSDPFLHKYKLYKPSRTDGVWRLVDRIKDIDSREGHVPSITSE